MLVLDTNVLSELLRPRPAIGVVRFVDETEDCHIAAISVTELMYGAHRMPAGKRSDGLRDAILQMIARFHTSGHCLPLDASAASFAAVIRADAERRGRTMEAMDVLIAGICAANDATLVTRNTSDFETTGLTLIDPWTGGI